MRNISKMTTLENKFPLLAVEHGCIVSKVSVPHRGNRKGETSR